MNRPIHFEIQVPDPEQVIPFYEKNFGWKFNKWEGPQEYWLVMTGADGPGIDGGLMRSPDGQTRTVNILSSTNLDEECRKVESSGGQNCVPKMAIPNVGWLAYFTDPGGALFGIMQMDASAK
jgi:predicted enzyme related to lactoylglutathione lyase